MKKLKSVNGMPLSYIKSVLKIDPTSPSGLTWLTKKDLSWNSRHANKNAGNISNDKKRYKSWSLSFIYKGKRYFLKCSRVIFLLHYGYLTKGKYIDHEDNNPLNNKIENLRECTKSQNQHNSKVPKNNTSGHKGVYWSKKSKKWFVRISMNGKVYHFGYFINKEDAIKVAITARKKLHGDFRRN